MNQIQLQRVAPPRTTAKRFIGARISGGSSSSSQLGGCCIAVAEILLAAPGRAWSAKDLCIELDGTEIKSTLTMVYRALKVLEGNGQIHREWAEQFGRPYSVYRSARTKPKSGLRLVCRHCGNSQLLDTEGIGLQLATAIHDKGFALDDEASLGALCSSCSGSPANTHNAASRAIFSRSHG